MWSNWTSCKHLKSRLGYCGVMCSAAYICLVAVMLCVLLFLHVCFLWCCVFLVAVMSLTCLTSFSASSIASTSLICYLSHLLNMYTSFFRYFQQIWYDFHAVPFVKFPIRTLFSGHNSSFTIQMLPTIKESPPTSTQLLLTSFKGRLYKGIYSMSSMKY